MPIEPERGVMMFYPVNIIPPIPSETARHARAIFSSRNFYIQVGEHLESILKGIQADYLYETGALLPQITFFQFLEGLTDAQAIDAARTRLDWKFALHLPIYPPVLPDSALCEFRQMILIDPVCQREFQKLIDRLLIFNPPLNNSVHAIDDLEMVSLVCSVNRLGLIHETICQALESLACKFPAWLQIIALPHWYGRYNHTTPGFDPTATLYQQELAIQEIDTDIHYLLEEVSRSGSDEIKELPEIKRLDHIWMRHFERPGLALNDQKKFMKLSDCDFCICKERRNSGDISQ